MHAALILESNGYQNLYNVEDGFVIGGNQVACRQNNLRFN